MDAIEVPNSDHAPPGRFRKLTAAAYHPHPLDSPAVTTLWTHYATRFLRAFFASLIILALIVIVVDMLLNLGDILASQKSVPDAIRFLLLRATVTYVPYLIPVATFTAALFDVGQAARWHEVVALKAGGVSPLRATAPIFAVAAIISVAALFINEIIVVRAASSLAESVGGGQGSGVTVRSGAIWYQTGPVIYNAREVDADGNTVRGVRLFERDENGRLTRLIRAESGTRLDPSHWVFRDAEIRSFDPASPTSPPRVQTGPELEVELPTARSPRLNAAELASLSVWTLSDYVGAVLDGGGNPGRARALLHGRLTLPLMVLLFAVLAVPLALSVEQTRSLARPALQGVGLIFGFLLIREYSARFGARADLAAAVVPWLVMISFFAFGGWRLTRVAR